MASTLKRGVRSAQRRERRLHFQIDASVPSLVLGSNQGTLTDNGVGDFTITFTEPFARAPKAHVSGVATDTTGYSDASTVSTIDIKVETLAAVAADQDVYVEVIGWDSDDEI